MKSTKKSDDDSLLQNPNKILRKSKWQLAVSDIATTVAPRQRQKKTNCLKDESSHDGVSGTDNDEQSLNNSASVFHLWLLGAIS